MKTSMLLLGGSGQLGTELRRLAGERYDIIAPDRSALNLADMDALSATVRDRRPDIVINAVALQVLETCEAHFADALAVNAVAVSRLAKAAEATGARFVTISSDYVFDGLSRTPYRETDWQIRFSVTASQSLLENAPRSPLIPKGPMLSGPVVSTRRSRAGRKETSSQTVSLMPETVT